MGLVSSARDTHSPGAGNNAALGEALGGVESTILLMIGGVRGWSATNAMYLKTGAPPKGRY